MNRQIKVCPLHLLLTRPEPGVRSRSRGVSLLEVAMLMLIMTLALAPMVRNLGGPSSANGTAARVIGTKSKEILLANTLIEQAMANNFNSFVCNYAGSSGPSFNRNNLPGTNTMAYYPSAGSRCTVTNNTTRVYYQWQVRNAAQPNSLLPVGNQYYNAVLNVYSTASGGTPVLSMPSSFFYNSSGATTPATKTGIVVVQDISGSMVWSQQEGTIDSANGGYSVASPYLTYRYADPSINYNPPPHNPSIALPWANGANANNAFLDIVSAENANDPSTPWDDRYPVNGVLGLGQGPGFISNCSTNGNGNSAWNSANWSGSMLYTQAAADGATVKNILQNICTRNPNWSDMMNENVSRVEASRSSLLNFIVSMEADPTLYKDTKLGLYTFSSPSGAWGNNPSGQGWDRRVALEGVDANNRFPNMRRKVSWINREGTGQIVPGGATWYTDALTQAARDLFADRTLNNRFILLVSDGAPNGPGDSHAELAVLSTQIGNGTFPGSGGNKATIFTLGLMSNDPNMPVFLRDDIAQNSPGGQFFQAQNVGDVTGIFDQIKYQIQKSILLSKSNRYNIDLD